MSADPHVEITPEAGDPAALARGRHTPEKRRALPRGVILLGLLLYSAAFVLAAAGIIAPAAAFPGLPRWVYLLYALVLGVLATGLLRRRRWAWLAMLAFSVVNGYYLLLGTAERGQNSIVGLTILAIVTAYLLWPGVRAVYLRRDA